MGKALFGWLRSVACAGLKSASEKALRGASKQTLDLTVAAARAMAQQNGRLTPFGNMRLAVGTTMRQEGIKGFYTGMLPNLLQVVPNAALSYFAYETFKQMLGVKD